jgi:hypothetical protein
MPDLETFTMLVNVKGAIYEKNKYLDNTLKVHFYVYDS